MATMNISLPDPMKAWVEAQSENGRYSNASDYVRDLIRRDQERTEKVAALQALITEGLESGSGEQFVLADFLSEMKKQHAKRSR